MTAVRERKTDDKSDFSELQTQLSPVIGEIPVGLV